MKTSLGMLGLAVIGLSSCARSPAGGPDPDNGQAVNRMTVSMTLQQAVDQAGQNYYYSFAFDDNQNRGDGPVAIVGPTSLTNGVVGGSFGVLVQYHAGQFIAYRRERLGSGTNESETLIRVPNAFVTPPVRPSGTNTIAFTLNLDATYTDPANGQQVRLFRSPSGGAPQELDFNFVTTDLPPRDPNNVNSNAYDALYPGSAGRWYTINDIRASQVIDNRNLNIEPANDVFRGTNRNVNVAALDITGFRVEILRANTN